MTEPLRGGVAQPKIGTDRYLVGCYRYFFWEAEFNDEGKNQGFNENHVCNILNFFTNSSSGKAKK